MTTQQRLTTANSAALILVTTLTLAPVTGRTAVLGEPVALSAIGEPLRIELPVLGGDPARAGECLRLVFERKAGDLPWVREGRITATGRGAAARIVITHPAPSFEPVLRLGIEDSCDSRLRREYTLLLSFPDAAPAGTLHSTAIAPPPTETGEVLEPLPQPPRPVRPRTPRERAGPAGPAGATPRAEAPARSGATVSAAGTATRNPAPARDQDRLTLGGGFDEVPGAGLRMSTELTSLGRIEATSDSERDQLRREQMVVMAIDRTIVAQLELNDRIRQLEEVQARMMERAQDLAATPAAAPVRMHASPTPSIPTQPPRRDPKSDWLYPATALFGVALALAAALLRIRQRRVTSEPAAQDFAPTARRSKPRTPPATPRARMAPPVDAAPLPSHTETPAFPHLGPAERSPLGWETAEEAISPIAPIAPLVTIDEPAEEHESAIELAEIMMGFGRIQGAADTLAEFIASNPKRAVTPWLKLLEVYRAADLREEFDTLARELNKTFNVKSVTWDTFDEARQSTHTMEQMAHVARNVQQMWGTADCQAYLEVLLRDNRDGTREGFPLSVIDEILVLAGILEEQLGPYRPPVETDTHASV
jgi:hypothetical protein